MTARPVRIVAVLLATCLMPIAGRAADLSCNGIVPSGQKMICGSFEPNWALELACGGASLAATFTDAFSGNTVTTTAGSIAFSSQNPWTFMTSQGVGGSIAYTPGACVDESDTARDFTLTPTAVPGASLLHPTCCRIE